MHRALDLLRFEWVALSVSALSTALRHSPTLTAADWGEGRSGECRGEGGAVREKREGGGEVESCTAESQHLILALCGCLVFCFECNLEKQNCKFKACTRPSAFMYNHPKSSRSSWMRLRRRRHCECNGVKLQAAPLTDAAWRCSCETPAPLHSPWTLAICSGFVNTKKTSAAIKSNDKHDQRCVSEFFCLTCSVDPGFTNKHNTLLHNSGVKCLFLSSRWVKDLVDGSFIL